MCCIYYYSWKKQYLFRLRYVECLACNQTINIIIGFDWSRICCRWSKIRFSGNSRREPCVEMKTKIMGKTAHQINRVEKRRGSKKMIKNCFILLHNYNLFGSVLLWWLIAQQVMINSSSWLFAFGAFSCCSFQLNSCDTLYNTGKL